MMKEKPKKRWQNKLTYIEFLTFIIEATFLILILLLPFFISDVVLKISCIVAILIISFSVFTITMYLRFKIL